MNTLIFFIFFVCILVLVLLIIHILVSISNPYSEKVSPYECGFSGIGDTRQPFSIQYYLVGILYLVFALEIFLLFPFAGSLQNIGMLGYVSLMIFISLLTIGFIYEYAKGALKFENLSQKDPHLYF
jgi:NADH-quinone oxidoreductase subunit A